MAHIHWARHSTSRGSRHTAAQPCQESLQPARNRTPSTRHRTTRVLSGSRATVTAAGSDFSSSVMSEARTVRRRVEGGGSTGAAYKCSPPLTL